MFLKWGWLRWGWLRRGSSLSSRSSEGSFGIGKRSFTIYNKILFYCYCEFRKYAFIRLLVQSFLLGYYWLLSSNMRNKERIQAVSACCTGIWLILQARSGKCISPMCNKNLFTTITTSGDVDVVIAIIESVSQFGV
jgi:hypothetical protein